MGRNARDHLSDDVAGIIVDRGAGGARGDREELAVLAGLSPDHYSRLEQGRTPPLVAPRAARAADPGMLRLIGTLDQVPALLLGRRSEVLARNALLIAVLGTLMEPGSSFAQWLFLDPDARARIVNWADFASAAVGALRYQIGRYPDDRRLAEQIEELRRCDVDFDRWWADQRVTFRTSMTKRISHPTAGPLSFGIESVIGPHDPEQRLVVYTVEPGSPTALALPFLTSWGGLPAAHSS